MIAAIRALTWEILARHRWLVGGSAAWLVVACLIAAVLPDSRRGPNTAALLLVPAIFGIGGFLAAVSHGHETRLDTSAGAFPRRLLRLPVSAGLLGGVPMALAIGFPVLVWVVVTTGVVRRCGVYNVPIVWPGLLIGVVLAWLLALCWSPMPYRWFRLGVIAVVMSAFVAGIIACEEYEWPESRRVVGLAGLAFPAVGLALWGVSRSRFEVGDDPDAPRLATPLGGIGTIAPFRSRLRAQLWLEWRTHGRGLLWLTLMLGVMFVPVVLMNEYVRRKDPWLGEYLVSGALQGFDFAWLPAFWLLIIPMILAGASGSEAGRFDQRQKTVGVPAFVGLMPIPTVSLVRGKFIASAIHLALMWGVLLAIALTWAALGGYLGGMADYLREACGSTAMAWATLVVSLVGLYAVSYLIYVGSMWLGLLGAPSFAPIPAFVGLLGICLAVYAGQRWQPGYEPILREGLWVALGAKLLLSAWLVRHDLTRHRVGVGSLGAALLVWAGLTAVPAWMAAWMFGDTAALAVVVLSPLATCLVTPAFLHRSRHGAWA